MTTVTEASATVCVRSSARDKAKFPNAAHFEVDVGVDATPYSTVRLLGYRLPDPYIVTVRAGENFFRFSEDLIVFDRVSEEQNTYNEVKTAWIEPGYYESITEVITALEEAINSISVANIVFYRHRKTDLYRLVSNMEGVDGTLCAFHVFAGPLLDMLGFQGHTDHVHVGTIPYFTEKASLTIRGALPKTVAVGDTVVLANLLPNGALHSESAIVTAKMVDSFEIDHRPAFSDHLTTVHYGKLYSISPPRRIPQPDNRPLFLSLPGLAAPSLRGSHPPCFALLNVMTMEPFSAPCVARQAGLAQRWVVEVREEDGRIASLGKEELHLVLQLTK